MSRFPFIVHKRKSVSIVIGRWGLGNRIISIGCALNLAAELNYRLVVYWPADNEVGKTRFDNLFDTTVLPFELVEGYEAQVMGSTIFTNSEQLRFPQNAILRLFRSLILSQYDKKIKLYSPEAHGQFMVTRHTDLPNYHKILILANRLFRYGCDVAWLKPLPQIALRIVELKNKFIPNTVGVHFRGTDWYYTPPVENTILRMRAEVKLDPGVKFFLASDGDARGKVIEDLFGDRLIMNTTHNVRRTFQGHESAVVDLFGLAGTSRIIAPPYTTFSLLASILGNKPLLRVRLR